MKIATTCHGVVSTQPIPIRGGAALLHHRTLKPPVSQICFHQRDRISVPRRLTAAAAILVEGYEDVGHVEYYDEVGERNRRGKREKRRMELVDCLVKDLGAFSELRLGEEDDESEIGDAKGKMVSEAAELLLAQLMQLRETEKKTKEKEKKDEMKRKMKAAKMKMKPDCESSSSSSESSSDSECHQLVDMAQLKRGLTLPPVETLSQSGSQGAVHEALVTVNLAAEPLNPLTLGNTCCNSICDSPALAVLERNTAEQPIETSDKSKTLQLNASVANGLIDISTSSSYGAVKETVCDDAASSMAKKIEVCMGGKCKKSGAPALMEEFQRVLGGEAAVVGCKCLGKCKSAPNVRVLQRSGEMDESEGNPLCIGVSLEDVGSIVANYLGPEVKDYGVAAA
ncbi:Diacylglycerol O-acyltransferase 3-like protein [Drosera capensis]